VVRLMRVYSGRKAIRNKKTQAGCTVACERPCQRALQDDRELEGGSWRVSGDSVAGLGLTARKSAATSVFSPPAWAMLSGVSPACTTTSHVYSLSTGCSAVCGCSASVDACQRHTSKKADSPRTVPECTRPASRCIAAP
jgi:hypothetical protein